MTKISLFHQDNKLLHCLLVLFSFSLLYVFLFSPVLLLESNKLLSPGDGLYYGLPMFKLEISLWTDLIFGGFPIAADPQSLTWYPVSLIFKFFSNSWNLFVISAYILASTFTYAYTYTITRSRISSLISGIIYGMSGALTARLVFVNMVHTVAWLPLVLFGIEKFIQSNQTKSNILWSIFIGFSIDFMFLAGHPQSFIYSSGLILIYSIFRIIPNKRPKVIARLLLIVFLSFLVISFAIFPQLELVANSVRVKFNFSDFIAGSFHPFELLNFIFPFLYGGYYNSPYGSYFGYAAGPHEVAGYSGLISIILASFAFFNIKNRTNKLLFKLTIFWLTWTFISIILSLGIFTPMSYVFYHIPGYNKVRVPSRHTFETAFSIAIMAGIGLKTLSTMPFKLKLSYLKNIVLLGFIIFTISVLFYLSGIYASRAASFGIDISIVPWLNLALLIPFSIFFCSSLICLWIIYNNSSRVKILALITFIIIDLCSASMFYDWRYFSSDSDLLRPSNLVEKYHKDLTASHQRWLTVGAFLPPGEIPPNISMLWGIETAGGYNPLIPSRLSQLLSMNVLGDISDEWESLGRQSLDIMCVRYVLVPKSRQTSILNDSERWLYVEDLGDSKIYRNLRAMPRTWLVPEVINLNPERVLESIQSSILPDGRVFNPRQTALVEENFKMSVDNFDQNSRSDFKKITNSLIKVESYSKSEGFLILSDLYYPGWKVKVDGQKKNLYQVDYLLKGVVLPKGHHIVDFYFAPLSFKVGIFVSIFSFGCLCYILLVNSDRPITN